MHVAYIITRSDSIGGAHVHVRDLAIALREKGHYVSVLVGGTGPFTDELEAHAIPYRSIPHLVREISPLQDLWAVTELRRELVELRPDIVSTHSSKAGWLGRVAAKLAGLPVIYTAHGWAFTEGVPERERRLYVIAERLAAPLADKIVTVSEFDRRLALEYRVASKDKLVIIHNGVPDVRPELRARPELHPPRVVMVARCEPQKDHVTLLEAFASLADLEWTLELIGDGPLRQNLEALAKRLGIGHRVKFLGMRSDVDQRLAKAQLSLLISNWEGFPLSILEAMRAGLPVIASDVGGVREAVRHAETGFLVPRGDKDSLRAYLRLLLTEPDLRVRMGKLGRRRYQKEFTFQIMLDKTLDVYHEVLERARLYGQRS